MPTQASTIFEHIISFMRANYIPEGPAETKKEADFLADKIRRRAAGRICETTREDFEEIRKFCEMKRLTPPSKSPWPIRRTLCD